MVDRAFQQLLYYIQLGVSKLKRRRKIAEYLGASLYCLLLDAVSLVSQFGFLRSDNDSKPLGPNVWCETVSRYIFAGLNCLKVGTYSY